MYQEGPASVQKILIASTVIIVLFLITLLLLNKGREEETYTTSIELYERFYTPIINCDTSFATEDTSLSIACRHLKDENFYDAIPLLKASVADYPYNTDILFSLGNAYQAIMDYNKAISTYHVILDYGAGSNIIETKWLVALIYVKNDRLPEAEDLLKEIRGCENKRIRNNVNNLLELISNN